MHIPTLIVSIAVIIGIITAFLLYKTAHVKKRLSIDIQSSPKPETNAPEVRSDIRKKIRSLPIKTENSDAAVQAITKLVEEETRQNLQEIRDEYSVKYQVLAQEKYKEIEAARKEVHKVTEQYESTQKLFKKAESEKKTTEAIVRSIAEGLVVVNEKGEVLLMNPSAEKLLGVQKEKKIGKPIFDNMRDEIMVSFSHDANESGEKVIEFKTKDENAGKTLRSSSAVIQNENGQTVGMVNILTDVTKQKELDGVKTRFVSNVTHELRTPIVAMQKSIAILLEPSTGPLNSAQSNFLGIVSRNLTHLNRLVEDLLDVAKIESGKMSIKLTPCRLDRVLNEVCDTLETWAKTKQIQMIRDFDRNLPEIPMDTGKITQVMNNLLSNAIKFTPAGGQITVKSFWPSRSAMHIAASVTDTGVGMSSEDMKKLFGRFEQFGDQVGIAGTGLGLSISKTIVEMHGGVISATSELKKGSTFTFTLPVKPGRIS